MKLAWVEIVVNQKTSEIISTGDLYPFRRSLFSIFVFLWALKSLLREKVNSLLWTRANCLQLISFIPVHRPSNFKMDFLRVASLLMVFSYLLGGRKFPKLLLRDSDTFIL